VVVDSDLIVKSNSCSFVGCSFGNVTVNDTASDTSIIGSKIGSITDNGIRTLVSGTRASNLDNKINQIGNIGLGVENPIEKLEVNGNIIADNLNIDN
jgi:hypothetical protein